MLTYTKIPINAKYREAYLPTPRCRKLRYRDARALVLVKIRTIDRTDARLAFELSDYCHKSQHQTQILCYKGKLYIRCWRHHTNEELKSGRDGYAVLYADKHHLNSPCNASLDLEGVKDYYKKESSRFLYIKTDDNKVEVWERCGEPRYLVNTFGLGHNHGETGLFVETFYNNNISNENYFPATKGKEAVAYANAIASGRGDTKDIGRFSQMIAVHMPEMVKLNPKRQHGKGNPIINKINQITAAADSALEAGLLTMAFAFNH